MPDTLPPPTVTTFYQGRNPSDFMVIGDGATIFGALLTPRMARDMVSEARELLAKAECDLAVARLPHVPLRRTGMASLDRICEALSVESHAGWIETCEARVARIGACLAERVATLARVELEEAHVR